MPNPIWDPDDEEHPRNAAAIRTAIMIGAEFFQDVGGMWQIKGIDSRSNKKTMPSWLFLATHGLCIDEHGSPVAANKMKPEDGGRFESYRLLANIVGPKEIKRDDDS